MTQNPDSTKFLRLTMFALRPIYSTCAELRMSKYAWKRISSFICLWTPLQAYLDIHNWVQVEYIGRNANIASRRNFVESGFCVTCAFSLLLMCYLCYFTLSYELLQISCSFLDLSHFNYFSVLAFVFQKCVFHFWNFFIFHASAFSQIIKFA